MITKISKAKRDSALAVLILITNNSQRPEAVGCMFKVAGARWQHSLRNQRQVAAPR